MYIYIYIYICICMYIYIYIYIYMCVIYRIMELVTYQHRNACLYIDINKD